MGKMGAIAAIEILSRFMASNFSADTIEQLFSTLRSFPKETQDEMTEQLLPRLYKEDLTEEEALEILERHTQH